MRKIANEKNSKWGMWGENLVSSSYTQLRLLADFLTLILH